MSNFETCEGLLHLLLEICLVKAKDPKTLQSMILTSTHIAQIDFGILTVSISLHFPMWD